MKILTQTLLLAALLSASGAGAADNQDFDVLQSMSVAQFRSAGLDKLSDAQLKALDTWFNQYLQQQGPVCTGAVTAPAAAAPSPSASAIAPQPPTLAAPAAAAPDSIEAHIVGSFDGWHGSTRVTLDNGQVWEEVDDSMVTVGRLTNPKVTISRGPLNGYLMTIEGVRDTVQVRRIKP